ncbi:MAG TPA: sulfatase [Agriterribacter sp.]|nr:sulfatase [Agriterribacter sp.]
MMTHKKTWRNFFCCFIMMIAGQLLAAQNTQPPNIILILTDDLGWSCFSSPMDDRLPDSKSDYFETPNIDRFAQQAMRFTRGYAPDPICTPSRRSIQFGQTSIRQGDETFPANYAPGHAASLSIPQALKAVNPRYRAAHFGKWDLRAKITPAQVGYDESDGDTGNKNGDISQDREEKWLKHYITGNPKQMDSITSRAIRFMMKEVKEKSPFYLQVSHYATHVNFESKQASYDQFNAKTPGRKHTNPAWAAMINDLDASIGNLLKTVETLGIANNTYIFLMADNGAVEFIPPVKNRLDPASAFDAPMRNYPLRGGKWTLYEGGIRVPFIVKGPGIKAGSQSDVPVAGWDLLPTFVELCGNAKKPIANVDGGSMVAVLKNGGWGKVERLSNDFFFHRYNNGYPHSSIIAGDDKLIKFWKTNKTELYNIKNDIGETHDISKEQPEKAKALEDQLLKYINGVNPALAKQY